MIIYGFADFHATRNIKNPLSQRNRGHQEVFPFCDAHGCGVWSGKEMGRATRASSFLALVEDAWDKTGVWFRLGQARLVTERLLEIMRDEARAQGLRFLIAPVVQPDHSWRSFLSQGGFEVSECVTAEMNQAEFHLPDGHPNARWTDRYSECLARYIRSSL